MTGKTIGIGWAKTGTTTLGECLRLLGNNHVSGRLDLVDHLDSGDLTPVLDVLATHDSAEDWPWLLIFREIDAAFPGSRFVLTTRDPEAWLRSYRNMVAGQDRSPILERRREILYGFNPTGATDQQLVDRIARHNTEVRDYFADRPDDLLEVDWSRGDGWDDLTNFLGVPAPDVPFPHANTGTYSAPRNVARRAAGRARRLVGGALRG